jgi:geranylgeranyl pyrophosphate synthase
MGEIPASLEFAEKLMKVDLFTNFNIPEDNRKMGKVLQEYLDRGGKYLRPGIIFSTVKTYGFDPTCALWAAVSLNYDHNFFLIHDDFEDDSRWRRGKPTMHMLYGDDFAINYGDYLRTLAEIAMNKGLSAWGSHTYERLVKARQEMLKTTCEGQDLEFQLRVRPLSEMTEEKVLAILRNKTACYTVLTPYRYGGIIAGLPNEQIEPLTPYLINIGIAFQIIDDILGLTKPKEEEMGRPTLIIQKFGKDWAGDLEEGKRTLLLQKLYARAKEHDLRYICEKLDIDGEMRKLVRERDELRKRKISDDDPSFKEIVRKIDEIKVKIIDMMHSYKAIENSQIFAERLYKESIPYVEKSLPDGEGKKELLELFNFTVFRKF